jgi:hypothetical protein
MQLHRSIDRRRIASNDKGNAAVIPRRELCLALATLPLLVGCATLAKHPTGFKPANYTIAAATVGLGYWMYAWGANNRPIELPEPQATAIRRHAIFIGDHAHALNVRFNTRDTHLDPVEYAAYLDSMVDAIDRSKASQVLIYVHGGMNDLAETPEKSWKLFSAMGLAQDTTTTFPIFVDWESGLRSSYVQHLSRIRQGRYEHTAAWVGIFPYVYSIDFVSGLARAPYPIGSALLNRIHADADDRRSLNEHGHAGGGNAAPRDSTAPKKVRVDSGHFLPRHQPVRDALSKGLIPFQLASAPLVDMFGSPAWENMHRRTSELFQRDGEIMRAEYTPRDGALAQLLDRLERYFADTSNHRKDSTKVVLIGHSMGTIVIARFLRESKLPISDIVFMAGAATVRQFGDAVVPYLETHPRARFYNLTLHSSCEIRETHAGGLTPNGSLLVWLDDYLNRPETPEDNMIGRWTSLPAVQRRVPPDIAPRVTFKGFGYRDSTVIGSFGKDHSKPCQHGEFSDPQSMFWRRSFWEVRGSPTM